MVAIVVAPVVLAIPEMVVFHPTMLAIPVSGKVASPFVAGKNPSRAEVRDARPITDVPLVMISNRVPIAFDPREVGAGADRAYAEHTGRRWRSNSDSDGYLSDAGSNGQEHEHG